jgi:hypothetical protein
MIRGVLRPHPSLIRKLPALAICLLWAAPARGGDGFSSPSANSTLLAGTELTVRWSGAMAREKDVREMELLLSIDGGQTFGVRVTAEIDPDFSDISWRVPSLPTAHARLALRVGSGDEESEAIALVSEEFSIEAHPSEPPEDFFRVGAEWRTRDALTIRESELPAPGSLTSEPELSARTNSDVPMTPPPTKPLVEPPPPSREPAPSSPVALPIGLVVGSSMRRVPLPLRE